MLDRPKELTERGYTSWVKEFFNTNPGEHSLSFKHEKKYSSICSACVSIRLKTLYYWPWNKVDIHTEKSGPYIVHTFDHSHRKSIEEAKLKKELLKEYQEGK